MLHASLTSTSTLEQMPPDTTLAVSHDVSQILQDQLETLPLVERCFVHVDYETDHQPEHRKFY